MIGVFDSGVGGLTVLAHLRRELPHADLFYIADQARAPYGTRPLAEVASIATELTTELMERGATTVVVACHTASAAALHLLRAMHPSIRFVGMEPAVKPAALATRSGVIGVLATAATFQGRLYESVVSRHASHLRLVTTACPNWVTLVERGMVDGDQAHGEVEECLTPVLAEGADTLVLGCTHFPFLGKVIAEVAGPEISIVDPTAAVARQAARIQNETDGGGELVMATTGDPSRFAAVAHRLSGLVATRPPLALSIDVTG